MLKRSTTTELRADSSGDRLLAVLALFTVEQPEWTVEAAADRLGVSATTSYRYFQRLTKAGLISPVSGASYTLGPAIIAMDRQIQVTDPMLIAARAVMADLIEYAAEGSVILLCRLFHDRVMCVHQVMGRGPQSPVSYERGRLMPLFRGATARIILANLPTRTLKTLFARNEDEIAAVGLGHDWNEFRNQLAKLRREGFCVSRSELDPGRVGVAAPIFSDERAVLGSLSFVLPDERADDRLIGRLAPLTVAGAREIERAMMRSAALRPSPARVKIVR
jgi:DNA-binding IclR family transcriptional regulator